MIHNRRWSFFLLVAVLLTIAGTGCGLLDGASNTCDVDSLEMLRLQPPPTATGLTENCVPGLAPGNAQYRATFNMSPADLQALQGNTLITDWRIDAADASVWDSEAANASSLLLGTYVDGFYMQEVLIDTSDPALYKVYFFNAIVD